MNPDRIHYFKPQKSKQPTFATIKTGVTSVAQFTAEEYRVWKDIIQEYDRKKTDFDKIFRNLNTVRILLRISVAKHHLHYIYSKQSIYKEIIALKNRFASIEKKQRKELKRRYKELQNIPKNQEIDFWLSKWEEVYSECVRATKNRSPEYYRNYS